MGSRKDCGGGSGCSGREGTNQPGALPCDPRAPLCLCDFTALEKVSQKIAIQKSSGLGVDNGVEEPNLGP